MKSKRNIPDVQRVLKCVDELLGASSKTADLPGIASCVSLLETWFRSLGMDVRREPTKSFGDILIAETTATSGDFVLCVGHLDTVKSTADWQAASVRGVEGNRYYGPGAMDMKGGLVQLFLSLELLYLENALDSIPLRVFIAPDEEVGFYESQTSMETNAQGARAAFVFEAGRDTKQVLCERKGINCFDVSIRGIEGHSGVAYSLENNAIVKAGTLVGAVREVMGRYEREGVTINIGTISGGTARNVIAGTCELKMEIRAPRNQLLDEAYEALLETAKGKGLLLEVRIDHRVPAWEKSAGVDELLENYTNVAKEFGVEILGFAPRSSGGSQANGLPSGFPIIDAMGPLGSGAHTLSEYVELDSIGPRAAAFATWLRNDFEV